MQSRSSLKLFALIHLPKAFAGAKCSRRSTPCHLGHFCFAFRQSVNWNCPAYRVGWIPSHFAQCSEGQKLLGNMLKGSPVTASQIASLMANHKQHEGLTKALRALDVRGCSIDHRGTGFVLRLWTSATVQLAQHLRGKSKLDLEHVN